jgi:hypothetical protein
MRYRTRDVQKSFCRYHGLKMALCIPVFLLTACLPSSPLQPNDSASQHLSAGAFYLRTVDGRALPVVAQNGLRIQSGYVVTDSTAPGVIGFGESVGHEHDASMRLATGSARVLGEAHGTARIAAVTWQADASAARADSVLWGADSVIVYRTGTAPSVAGAGHRFIYTRATPADTL